MTNHLIIIATGVCIAAACPTNHLEVSSLNTGPFRIGETSMLYSDIEVKNTSAEQVLSVGGIHGSAGNWARPQHPDGCEIKLYTSDGRSWMAEWKVESETGNQVIPPSTVFQTPPPVAPM